MQQTKQTQKTDDTNISVSGISGTLTANRIPAVVWRNANLQQKIEIQVKMGINYYDAIVNAEQFKNEEYLDKMTELLRSKLFTFTRNHCLDERDRLNNLDIDKVNSWERLIFSMTGRISANQNRLVICPDGTEYWTFEN